MSINNNNNDTPLKNTLTIITGAGSGLGFATAQYFIEQGSMVALLDINIEQGRLAITELASPCAHFYHVDVTNEGQVEAVIVQITEQLGPIHHLINCAGIAPAQRTLDRDGKALPLAMFKQVIDINLVGSMNVAKAVAQQMATQPADAEKQRGVIINTASVAGYEGQIGQTAYAASKAGIIGLCLPMARDLAPLGIRVNTIAPGIMATPMLLSMPENVQAALSDTVVNPKRLGAPREFARLAEHICTNRYLNGETIRLDGALRMGPK